MFKEEDLINDLKFLLRAQGNNNVPGSLPDPSYTIPKIVLKEYLESVFKSFNLKNPLFISTAYPSESFFSQGQTSDGKISLAYNRGISVVLKSSNIQRYIGSAISQYQEEDIQVMLEKQSIDIVYWSIDPLDRDKGADLVKRLLLEGLYSKYFLVKGMFIFYIDSSRDEDEPEKIVVPTSMLYKHIISTSTYRFIWGRRKNRESYGTILQINIGGFTISIPQEYLTYFDGEGFNSILDTANTDNDIFVPNIEAPPLQYIPSDVGENNQNSIEFCLA
jgi:hypothetical protein